jgi:uncharacterized protein
MANSINWFEIPVTDFERAKKFYGHITGSELHVENMGPFRMGFLGGGEDGVHGAIVAGEGYSPSEKGSLIYLNGGEDLSEMLKKVEEAGGNVVVPKTQITPEIGYFAIFIDSEGNKMAMHSPK